MLAVLNFELKILYIFLSRQWMSTCNYGRVDISFSFFLGPNIPLSSFFSKSISFLHIHINSHVKLWLIFQRYHERNKWSILPKYDRKWAWNLILSFIIGCAAHTATSSILECQSRPARTDHYGRCDTLWRRSYNSVRQGNVINFNIINLWSDIMTNCSLSYVIGSSVFLFNCCG